jgi:uncharacterized protein YegP (UPF0339 family)
VTDVIEVLPSKGGGYYFRKRAANNRITSSSGSETYEHPFDAKAAAIKEYGDDIPVRVIYRKDQEDDEGGD